MENSTNPTTPELAKGAAADALALVKAELDVAKNELRADLAAVREGAGGLAVSSVLAIAGAAFVLGAIVAAGRRHPLALALLGIGCVGAAFALGSTTLSVMPRPLARTRRRVAVDTRTLEENLR